MAVRVQREDFDLGAELAALRAGRTDIGALVSFTGLVRDRAGGLVDGMELEHYPGMTEKALGGDRGRGARPLAAAGQPDRPPLRPAGARRADHDGRHRLRRTAQAAFAAAEFLMDYLKSRAPFWKKETAPAGSAWVEAREADEAALARWRGGS